MSRHIPKSALITCVRCGRQEVRSPRARYCHACSEERDLERKRIHARLHPREYDPVAESLAREVRTTARRAAGAAKSDRLGSWWPADCDPELQWLVRVKVPFVQDLSKNAIWRNVRAGHTYLRTESRRAREGLALVLRSALHGRRVAHNRLWVDIGVEKPHHRTDASNFVDSILDAVEEATGLDDRWYSLRRLDWRIVKLDPQIYVGIGQEAGGDALACSCCGRVLPLEAFGLHAGNPLGRSRTCRECSRAVDRMRRERREGA